MTDRQIRDGWLAQKRVFKVPARLWKETLRDGKANIEAYREACKVKVRKAVRQRTNDEDERKRLYTALKADHWPEVSFLHRQMRPNAGVGGLAPTDKVRPPTR